jgi:hypothetical protein
VSFAVWTIRLPLKLGKSLFSSSYSTSHAMIALIDPPSSLFLYIIILYRDGTVVNATATFNIDGHIVRPPVTNLPVPGTHESPAAASAQQSSFLAGGGPVPPSFTLPLLVPAEEELYPTLTLHHPGMSVMCRFSAGDILAQSREAIGAPTTVPIFTVDGSIVFDDETH